MAQQRLAENDMPMPNGQEYSAIEQAERATQRLSVLGEMTGGIAHDFRNILAVIDSSLRLAERNAGESEKLSKFIAGAREGVARGLRLTSQLLIFAQQREISRSAADVNTLLVNLDLFLKYGAGPTVRIVLNLSPDIPYCFVDPSQFAAAVLNLVINSRDAMPDGGTIEISTSRCKSETATVESVSTGDYVRIRVKDDGVGIPKEVMQRIFEPFFTTKGEKGTGLGIPQVCAFMRHVGGRLSVESEPGGGTTSDLLFPVIENEADQSNLDEFNYSISSVLDSGERKIAEP